MLLSWFAAGAASLLMVIVLTILHVFVCFFLVVVVLLQSGKAADLAGAFGGMGSQTAFGPRGAATVLSKATTIAAGLFMLTSLTLSVAATRGGRTGSTVLEKHSTTAPKKQPGQTSAPANAPITVQTPAGTSTINVPAQPPVQSKPAEAQPVPAPAKK